MIGEERNTFGETRKETIMSEHDAEANYGIVAPDKKEKTTALMKQKIPPVK